MAVIDIEDYLQHPDSVDYYVQRAMDRFPGDPKLIIRKANRQYMKGNLTGAIDSFHEAMTLTESDSLKGELWGYVGDTFHAIAERRVEQLKAKIKRDTSAYPVKMKPQKAIEECFAAYDKALALYPDNAMVLNNYAYFLSELDMELEKALTMSTRAIMLSENNSTHLDTHAWVLYKIGRYDEARNVMRKALMLDRSGSEALLMHYGDILYALKDKFMAETYWKKALEAGADPREVERRMAMLKETSDEK
jgi:tetratricopeptide (TPR) repeat protein